MADRALLRTRAAVLVVAAGIAALPATGAAQAQPQGARPAAAPEAAASDGSPTGPKPAIRGLVSMGAYRFVGAGGDPVNTLAPLDAKAGIFGGLVVISTWRQLQPEPGGAIPANNPIDQAMAEVRAYNQRNPNKPIAVRLRVWGGFEAPAWAMALGGPPIETVHNGTKRQLGRFWTAAYRAAWRDFQAQLAAKYDGFPLIRETAMTSCMSYTAEPFFLPTEPTVQQPIRAAGFNEAQYRQCLEGGVEDFAGWKRTRIVLSVNPLRTGPNQGNGDPQFTIGVMRACRQQLGVRCVFDNHDLDTEQNLAKPLVPIYAAMKSMGPEIVLQTLQETPPDFDGVIAKGVAMGATAIELWQDYKGFPLESPDRLRKWAALIEANHTR
ncbi:MAG: hypothetical protein U1F10_02105 [Burkholderiales bacterium]